MSQTTIHTDGGSHGNPGPGGWAFVVQHGETILERAGSDSLTTNNKMELTAVIQALRFVQRELDAVDSVLVTTDSQYVKNGITSWIHTWIRNGWKTAAKKPVKNRELWEQLYELSQATTVQWAWVRGHAGDVHNERCDQLVQQAIAAVEV